MNCKIKKTAVLAPLAELVLGVKTPQRKDSIQLFLCYLCFQFASSSFVLSP